MSKSIRLVKKDGEILRKEYVLNALESAFATIANGEHILSLTRKMHRRSLPQNALLWLWLTCIEKETGTEKGDVHDYYCGLFLRRPATVNGKEVIIAGGTSKLNTVQFTEFLNKVQADAASELGIRLPNPGDLHFEEFRQDYERYFNYYEN